MGKLLITGGTGFLGSHTCLVLIEAGYDIIILDSFINSSPIVIDKINKICGIKKDEITSNINLIKGDIREENIIDDIFTSEKSKGNPITGVIHFAGLKSVNESIKDPFKYWDVNVNGCINLLKVMEANGCRTIVFSSSATIYGDPELLPIKEDAKIKPVNTYGNTKASIEKLLLDVSRINKDWKIACLRYFNPVGAHPSGSIGEAPNGNPNNLFPIVTKVALGQLPQLNIYGGDWETPDGTCIRDYIHVMDLADGHLAALNYLKSTANEFLTLNLGTGKGYSVLEITRMFSKVINREIPYKIIDRRPGDVSKTIADPSKAKSMLGWECKRSLREICKHTWKWASSNPYGYQEKVIN
tara:strand:+ start:1360 stop:2427 length:1068 start_codon:yes stop_codon:yes gene_type:complete